VYKINYNGEIIRNIMKFSVLKQEKNDFFFFLVYNNQKHH